MIGLILDQIKEPHNLLLKGGYDFSNATKDLQSIHTAIQVDFNYAGFL